MKKPKVSLIQAFVGLLILTLLVGGGNLWASWDQVHAYKVSQQREQAVQQRQQAAEQRQGQLLERRLCTTLGRLASRKPPSGSPSDLSRAYLEWQHDTLAELGPDIGCGAPRATP